MNPTWVRIIAVAVVVGVVVSGIGIYYFVVRNGGNTSCALKSKNPIVIDQAEKVASIDPHAAFSTPEWGAVQQTYQPLVMYNGTSYTNFSPMLAQNWSSSADGFHWNFTLFPGIHFSNGDPVTAYTMWFSFYRLLALQGADQYLLSENFWIPGLNYYAPATQNQAEFANLTQELNTWDFLHPSGAAIAAMTAPNQSFQVLDNRTIELNLGNGYLENSTTFLGVPYKFLLAEMATPGGVAVDPVVIQANGGVTNGLNAWMSTHSVGTGPYLISSFDPVSGMTFTPDPNYWAAGAAAKEPWNVNLQPAKSTIQVNFQLDPAINVQDLKSKTAASASFAYLGPDTVHQLQASSCLTVRAESLVYSSSSGAWWVYMNQSVAPFNNLSVREAVVHAIDINQIITEAFGGYASSWVGPVPPSYPGYNPQNLPPYPYNLTLAKQEMANSPYPNGYSPTLNYEYLNTGPDWANMALLLKNDLQKIGISINPVPMGLDTFYQIQTIDPSTGQCLSMETQNGGPFPIGQDFYASDYISPDDWTQQDALSYGTANLCMSGYNNATVNNLVTDATGQRNPAAFTNDYAEMTSIMYNNYTDAWLVCPTLFTVYNPTLQGIVSTPMGSTTLSTMEWNSVYAS
ncbi:MAG: ABC transporter substrate-binding protein [Thermoplasmata archaeon]|nr:ABC transporter substrate-binding protein [Thermoplasmata archaeon]